MKKSNVCRNWRLAIWVGTIIGLACIAFLPQSNWSLTLEIITMLGLVCCFIDVVFHFVKKRGKEMSTQRAVLFIGSGKTEKRGKILRKLLEKADFDVIIEPMEDEDFLKLSRGGYMYAGQEIDLIEKQLKESNTFPTPQDFVEMEKKGDQTYDISPTKIDDNQKHD